MRIAGTAQVLAAMVLCGIGAEVLSGYSHGTGAPGAVVFQLLFSPRFTGFPPCSFGTSCDVPAGDGRACSCCTRRWAWCRRG